jgi:CRISPR-associated protein Cas8b1/Cst1 subtype I-B
MAMLISACQYKPESKLVAGNWKYTSVEKNNQSLFDIGDNDIMILQADSLFEYHINSINKHMYGKWSYSDHTLHLKYLAPDTLRHFKVELLSDHLLKMREGEVSFNFTRVKTD